MKRYLAEAIGTFVLVFMGCSTIIFMVAQVGILGVAFSFGIAVIAMIYTFGPISGAHLNPAVSIGAWAAGRLPMCDTLIYCVAQILGGLVAVSLMMVMGGDPAEAATRVGVTGVLSALIFEFVATMIFVTVILGVTQEGPATPLAGLVIGLTLIMIHLAGISLSGASVNPARSIATNIFSAAAATELWLYFIAPVAGGLVAGLLYKKGLTSRG